MGVVTKDREKSGKRLKTTPRSFGHHAVRLGDLVLARAAAVLAPLDLKPLAYDTMVCINDGYGMSQRDLSKRLGIYAPQMVSLIDGLEKRGLVKRTVNPADRRRHLLQLTESGQTLLKRAAEIARAVEEEMFGKVPSKQKMWFRDLVERLEEGELAREEDPLRCGEKPQI